VTRGDRCLAVALALSLAGLGVAVNLPEECALLRHLYLLPVAVAALRFGAVGAVLTAAGVLVADGPPVLADVERGGLTPEALERLVTFALVLGGGALAGHLVDEARAQRRRYETLLAVQRALADDVPLEPALHRLRACLVGLLAAAGATEGVEVALVVRDGARFVVAGGDPPAPGSLAAAALEAGGALFVADAGGAARPRRAFATPLLAGGRPIGVLLVERDGELGARARAGLTALGLHLGLALENARLARRQRRFAEELERKVGEATRRLADIDRAKSRFLAVTSHELRTPLTALLGFAELLMTRRFEAAEVQRFAGIVHRETERLVRIVDDLLDLGRLERGLPPPLRRTRVDVGRALACAAELFARGRAGHRLRVESEDGLAADVDPDALDRILRNLVSNAVKYSPPGSTVTLRGRRAAAPGRVEVVVEDEGGGMSPEALARIFEPYYRTPEAAATARGAGLGLAVVKALAEAHGGAVEAASAPQTGTRIRVLLPALPVMPQK
jgi:signal transduction histidine kinase